MGLLNIKSVARDVLALGSWVFFLIVLARMATGPFRPVLDKTLIAGVFVLIVFVFWKGFDSYVSKGLILVYFTSVFYESLIYMVFVSIIGIGLIWSAWFVEGDFKKIMGGFFVGVLGVLIGEYGILLYY